MVGWFKIKTAALYADVSPRTLRSWLRRGLRHSRVPGGTVFIQRTAVDEFLTQFTADQADEVDAIVGEVFAEAGKKKQRVRE